MGVMYPLAIVDVASITSLVRMTLYHHSIPVWDTQVETNEDMVVLRGKARDAAAENLVTQPVSDIHGVRGVENQMAIEEATSK